MSTQEGTDQELRKLPVACTLGAAQRLTRQDEIARLFNRRSEVRELDDGYAVRFAGANDEAEALLRFIASERACCPFFTFELVFEEGQGPLWLRLRGPEGTKEIVEAMLA